MRALHMHLPKLTAFAAAVTLLLAGTACSSGSDDASSTSTTAPTTTESPATTGAPTTAEVPATTESPTITMVPAPNPVDVDPAPEPGGSAVDLDAALALFTTLRAEHCTASPTPEPVRAEPADPPSATRAVIVDAEDNRLVIDVTVNTVEPLGGPDDLLPRSYSFGCEPEVFLGTVDH